MERYGTVTVEPDYITRKPIKRRFQHNLSIRKYCQLFTHKSNTFLGEQYVMLTVQTNGDANAEKSQNNPFP